jgi:formamidopyrimidine-DNA glycosylase
MPELAEVDHSRRQWDPGLDRRVMEIHLPRPEVRIFRGEDPASLRRYLVGKKLVGSEARGKQMLFQFSGGAWLGVHLGMRGELRHERMARGGTFLPRKHDYLCLRMSGGSVLAFEDKRVFGRIRFHRDQAPPVWWTSLPPSVHTDEFTLRLMADFLARRSRAPLKAVLLMQECFHGVGNWMADEILWRARLHPAIPSGALAPEEIATLHRTVRWVSRTAMRIISDDWSYPPSWLFLHRWEPGGSCPRCGADLDRGALGGRTTAWCPACQPCRG